MEAGRSYLRRVLDFLRRFRRAPSAVPSRDVTLDLRVTRAHSAREDTSPVEERAWRDLALDDVFLRLDRCRTMIGRQTLYRRLRLGISARLGAVERGEFATRVEALATRGPAFERAVRSLHRRDGPELASLLFGRMPELPVAPWLLLVPALGTFASLLALFHWPLALWAVLGFAAVDIAIRLLLHRFLAAHAEALRSLTRLARAAALVAALPGLPPGCATQLRNALAVVRRKKSSLEWATMEEEASDEATRSVIAYLNVFFLLDIIGALRALVLLRDDRDACATLFEIVGDLDAAYAVAQYRAEAPVWSVPELDVADEIRALGLRHPLLDAPVPNDVVMTRESAGWLLLGSNASGKSTLAKALAVQAVLAQSIATTTCTSYAAPPLLVRTIILVEDDIAGGRSHFVVEAEAAREMLLGDPGTPRPERLCVVDELFRGTNTADRVAAATAFLRALRRDGAFVVAATHDAELLRSLEHEYRPHYFRESISAKGIVFDYRLHEGALAPRNALAILELAGFPAAVLEDARALSA